MPYPQTRLRRMRRSEVLRSLARETRLARTDLVLPAFVVEGTGVHEAVGSTPGVERLSAELVAEEAKAVGGVGPGSASRAPRTGWSRGAT